MGKFEVIVTERSTNERWTHSMWSKIEEAEDQRKTLKAAIPGAVIKIADWSNIPKITQFPDR